MEIEITTEVAVNNSVHYGSAHKCLQGTWWVSYAPRGTETSAPLSATGSRFSVEGAITKKEHGALPGRRGREREVREGFLEKAEQS